MRRSLRSGGRVFDILSGRSRNGQKLSRFVPAPSPPEGLVGRRCVLDPSYDGQVNGAFIKDVPGPRQIEQLTIPTRQKSVVAVGIRST